MLAEPGPALGPDLLLLGGRSQVHLGGDRRRADLTRASDTPATIGAVDFELTPTRRRCRDAAADLLASRSSPESCARRSTPAAGPTTALWSAMVDQGWCGIAVPEDAGGVGLGWVEAAVLLEQVGAHVAPAPILGQLVALDALAGTEWGAGLVDGSRGGRGGGRRSTGWSPYAPVGRRRGRVRGRPRSGRRPDRPPAGGRAGHGRHPHASAGCGPTPRRRAEHRARRRRRSRAAPRRRPRSPTAPSCSGIAQRVLDLSVEYAKDRVQFGRPIGSFQAVKHRCADMLVDVEGMRSAVYWAAWCVADRHEDASVAASTAKCWCSDAVTRVTSSALQVHGGIGFTWEHDVHLYLKRAQLDAISFGDRHRPPHPPRPSPAGQGRSRPVGHLDADGELGGEAAVDGAGHGGQLVDARRRR